MLNITNFKLYTPILYLTYIEYLTKFKFLIIIFKHLIIHFLLSHIIVRTDVSLITQYPYSMLVRVYNIYYINHDLFLTLSLSYFLNLCITYQHMSHIPPIYKISVKIYKIYPISDIWI